MGMVSYTKARTAARSQQAPPFDDPHGEESDDSFFNEKIKAVLRQRMDDMDAGRGVQHDLIELD